MPNLTQKQKDDLARFAGGKAIYPWDGPHAQERQQQNLWEFPDGQRIPRFQTSPQNPGWSPATKPEHGDLVLRALRKKMVNLHIWFEKDFCECYAIQNEGDKFFKLCISDWWPEAVCTAAIEVMEQEGGER